MALFPFEHLNRRVKNGVTAGVRLSGAERDRDVACMLKEKKIKCLIVWECTIKKMARSSDIKDQVICKCIHFLNSAQTYFEI